MGVCSSKVEEEQPVASEHDKSPGKAAATEEKGGDRKSGVEDKEGTIDFRETLKAVIILVLNRLATALEYEQEGFLDLAVKRSKKKLYGAYCASTL